MEIKTDNGERNLRKWCLEQALEHTKEPRLVLDTARKYYDFVMPPPAYMAVDMGAGQPEAVAIQSDSTGFKPINWKEDYAPRGDYNPLEEIKKEEERLRSDPNGYHKAHMLKVEKQEKLKEEERQKRIEQRQKQATEATEKYIDMIESNSLLSGYAEQSAIGFNKAIEEEEKDAEYFDGKQWDESDTFTNPLQASVQQGEIRLSRETEGKTPEKGLSQSRSEANGEGAKPDDNADRAGVPDRATPASQPSIQSGNNGGGLTPRVKVLNEELTANQISVLVHVCKQADLGREVSGKEISESTGIPSGSMGYLIETLESKGYAKRNTISPRKVIVVPLKRPDGREYVRPEKDGNGITRYETGRAENYGHVDLDRL